MYSVYVLESKTRGWMNIRGKMTYSYTVRVLLADRREINPRKRERGGTQTDRQTDTHTHTHRYKQGQKEK